ncbi:unnamed protein product [Brachionus calyciflorus]|uniref:Importin N-terminal domain-containing protein n=1 Tax=Brachionus calyciflorus TaxID=104777 RepID=A0A813W7S9_9BILA|nr:unnamed protein product [Brachionus calyciflorus]
MSYIESILQKLLTPDSNVIKQATKQLLDYFVSEKCVIGLFDVLKNSQDAHNRKFAATLLRKKVKNWKLLHDNEKTALKGEIIEVLLKEQDESVRKQITWLIASIYKYSVKSKQEWPQLLLFINELIMSPTPEQNMSGVFILSIITEEAAEQLKPHYVNLLNIFCTILTQLNNLKSAFYVISSLKNMIPFTSDETKELQKVLPLSLNASVQIIKTDQQEETITSVFDFLQILVEYDIPLVSGYIKTMAEMTLSFISDNTLLNPTRICSMNFLNILIETQKSNLLKNEMIRPIVNAVFAIMCQSNDPLQTKSDIEIDMLDDGDEKEIVDDTENIFTAATQVLDYCALYFPAKKLIKILIEYVSPSVTSDNPLHRRAALAALAITCEGCADYYKNHYLEVLTDVCVKGMQDSDDTVVQISYFALCQFSEFLQPNLGNFSNRIMNLLINSIDSKPELRQISRLTVRFYDALQSFCENLEDLEEHLPTLMSKLTTLELQSNSSLKLQRLIISTFSSIVCSVKSKYSDYFDYTVNLIKPYLSYNQLQTTHNDTKMLQIECVDLMGVFAKFIGKDKFTDDIVQNCLLFVTNALTNEADPEIRSAAYDLLAGLASKLKEKLPLNVIMPQIIDSLKNEEGINVIDQDDKKHDAFSAFDEIDLQDEELEDEEDDDEDEENDEGDSDDSQKLIVENEYVTEKLSAIICLQEILKFTNPQIYDYYDECFQELKTLLNFVHLNIRKESYLAVAYMISYFHDFCIGNLSSVNETERQILMTKFVTNLKDFKTKSAKAIEMDSNRELVMSVFDSIKVLLSRCAPFIKLHLAEFGQFLESFGNLIIETFQNKIYCQMVNNEETTNLEDNEAEYDYMLKEYAGDVLPSLALCLNNDLFDNYFEKVLVYLIRLLNKSESTTAEKSFVIGVVGETCANIENIKSIRAQQLFSEFYKYMAINECEIRSNTIYTIGVLCSQSANALSQYYPQIITDLYQLVKKEKNKQTLDNICGSLCRLCLCCFSANVQTVDFELLVKTIFDLTPLRVDMDEYHTLYTFISQTASNKILMNYYQKIVEISGHLMSNTHEEEFKSGTKEMAVQFLKYVDQNYKEELNILLNEIKTDLANTIRACLA